MSLRQIFNKHMWHTADLGSLSVIVRHRGAPCDERRISGSEISEIGPTGVLIAAWDDEDGATWIPYHRILEIRSERGVVWSKP